MWMDNKDDKYGFIILDNSYYMSYICSKWEIIFKIINC